MTDRQDVEPFDGFTTLYDTVHFVSLCTLWVVIYQRKQEFVGK